MSILHFAAMFGNFEMLKYLLSLQVFLIDDKSNFGIFFYRF